MNYSVTFHALHGQAFARRLRGSLPDLLNTIKEPFRQQFAEDESAWPLLVDLAGRIAQGDLPDDCDPDYFHALCWLVQAASERIAIPGYEGFRSLSFLDAVDIWPWLRKHSPPFPVPRAAEGYPAVGYFPLDAIEKLGDADWTSLAPSSDQDVLNARDDFRDVLESLVPDRLDLLAVLL